MSVQNVKNRREKIGLIERTVIFDKRLNDKNKIKNVRYARESLRMVQCESIQALRDL